MTASPTTERARPLHLLTFALAGQRFALPADLLRQVVRAVAITALPKAPPIVEGLINIRGTLVPVLDIRQRFRFLPAALAPEQHIIVAKADNRLVALRVDRALDLVVVDEDTIESASRVAPGTEYVAGIAKLADGLLVIHDLESFLSLEEAGEMDAAVVGGVAGGDPGQQRTGASSPQRKGKR
jgi:purine-binding chemotaxis protein CheW